MPGLTGRACRTRLSIAAEPTGACVGFGSAAVGGVGNGAFMAIFISRDGTAALAVEKLLTSSRPRADQRPCSTQNDAIGMLPDCGGSNRLTIRVRSC